METFYLIDFENVHYEGLRGILNLSPDDIDYIFLTHTHKDHIGALEIFLKKYYFENYFIVSASSTYSQ